MKAYCSNVLYCTTLSGVREKGHMAVQRTRGQAVCLSIWRKCKGNPVKWLSVGNYATLFQYFEWDWSTLCMFAVLPRDRFGLRRHCVTTTDENLKCDIPIQRHVVAICKVLIVGYDICHIRSSSTCSQTVSSCCSNTNGSLKNVPWGTDVLGKWKSVPGKIRIRASIFTSIFMLFYINIPFKLIVSDALRIAIKHECIF